MHVEKNNDRYHNKDENNKKAISYETFKLVIDIDVKKDHIKTNQIKDLEKLKDLKDLLKKEELTDLELEKLKELKELDKEFEDFIKKLIDNEYFKIYDNIPSFIEQIINEYFDYDNKALPDDYKMFVNCYNIHNKNNHLNYIIETKKTDEKIQYPTNIHIIYPLIYVNKEQHSFILSKLREKMKQFNNENIELNYDKVIDENMTSRFFRLLYSLKANDTSKDPKNNYYIINTNKSTIKTKNINYRHQLLISMMSPMLINDTTYNNTTLINKEQFINEQQLINTSNTKQLNRIKQSPLIVIMLNL